MFIRHGDRTPGRCLSTPKWRDKEASFWITKLPSPTTAYVADRLNQSFPVNRLGSDPQQFIDVARNPFGFLTSKGLCQLNEQGRRFSQRYQTLGLHKPCGEQSPNDFLSTWDARVYATNYLRTVLSVQSFLSGFLGIEENTVSQSVAERTHDPSMTKEACPLSEDFGLSNEHTLIPVMVRPLDEDPLNAFDRNPELVASLSTEVMTSAEFVDGDSSAAPLATRLANMLPGLVKRRGNDYAAQSPSGINWVEASDHFVCRSSHDIPLARFSQHENDDRIEQTLQALAHPTLAHLAWRFQQWYGNQKLLAEIAAPPLREVANQILNATGPNADERKPFVVYSCHDITILGLLYGIGAEFLEESEGKEEIDTGMTRYWPPYASNLVFELVRLDDAEGNRTKSEPSHIVRVLLNGESSSIPLEAISHHLRLHKVNL